MKFLALLLTCLCLPCFAQFPYSGVTWTKPPTGSPQDLVQQTFGIFEYWNSLDLTNGANVSNWVGRVQGFAYQQTTTANMPTNSANGVYFFNGGTVHFLDLTNNSFNFRTNSSVTNTSLALLVRWDGHDGNDHVISSDTNAFNDTEGNVYFVRHSTTLDGAQVSEKIDSGNSFEWCHQVNGMSNVLFDIFITMGNVTQPCYTNNVSTSENLGAIPLNTNYTRLGTDKGKTINWNGYIAAFALFTNQPFSSSSTRSNIHWQWTNQFKYSP